jgi:chromate reductase, NAD(P)H dehydrogenase (quinone)
MITIISGTVRDGSVSAIVAEYYLQLLKKKEIDSQLLNLEILPLDFAFNNNVLGNKSNDFNQIVEKYIRPAQKIIFVVPEYNGSIPGTLKMFIDGITPKDWQNKKASIAGIASGRGGNLRGIDHLTSILHYLGIEVMAYKIALSNIENIIDSDNKEITDEQAIRVINKQLDKFILF